ncbi:ATP-binding protein [Cystobacter fuscus]
MVARLTPRAGKFQAPLIIEADSPVVGQWDRSRLEQVVTHLLDNALKYGAGAPVVIRVTVDNGFARLSVRDKGIGIAPRESRRIFERYARAVSERNYGAWAWGSTSPAPSWRPRGLGARAQRARPGRDLRGGVAAARVNLRGKFSPLARLVPGGADRGLPSGVGGPRGAPRQRRGRSGRGVWRGQGGVRRLVGRRRLVPKAIIFEVDGTLVDSNVLRARAGRSRWRAMASRCGCRGCSRSSAARGPVPVRPALGGGLPAPRG